MTALTCDYRSLANAVGFKLFGLRPSSVDVITDGVASATQRIDILKCITKGLKSVYDSYTWSFLRPLVSITTKAPYETGTITVNSSGVVTGDGTTFPTYSASAGGLLTIPAVGSYWVATYSGATALTLTSYDGGAVTTATAYSISFPTYALPAGVESLEGRLTFPPSNDGRMVFAEKALEVEVRQLLAARNRTGIPRLYAETEKTFDPTVGSARSVSFFPVPDAQYILSGVGILVPSMIDATNKCPLGGSMLAEAIEESCLAVAEREFDDAPGIHNQSLELALAKAVQRDKERGSPDTLGMDPGQGSSDESCTYPRMSGIYWDAGGDYTGWL